MIDAAIQIAKEAGLLLLERFGRLTGAEIERKGPRDFVTAADRDAEALIVRRLSERFPGARILAEEGGGTDDARRLSTWVVDPLDGTTNFLHGIPFFCVSIGLVEAGRPVLGVVHAPAIGQTFWGGPGQGAWEGDRPISVSVTPTLPDALLATGFGYDLDRLPDDNLDNASRITRVARGIRRLGSAALDLAYVASGRLDGYWELHLKPWDIAGGAAILLAAGGEITDFRGGGDWLFGKNLVATNGMIHRELRESLSPLRSL